MIGKTIAMCVTAFLAASLGSCYYDPANYSGSASTASYSSGYGYGYGYGSPSFSTSVFVSTGNARWGYDPYCYAYYDYTRRCYYDPYGHGYYPVGYRPAVVVGCPHPYGWRPGRGYCPPPSYVRDVRWSGYQDRANSYRNGGYSWSKGVRVQPVPSRPNPATRGERPSNGYPAATPYRNQGVRPSNAAPSRGNGVRPSGSNKKRYISNQTKPTQYQSRQQVAQAQSRQATQMRTRPGPSPQQAQPNGRNRPAQGRQPAQNQRQYREEERNEKNNKASIRGLGRA